MILSTDVWVSALIRRAELGGAFATVARKGDARAGAVLVKTLDRKSGATRLYAEATGVDGGRIWMRPAKAELEAELDAYVERAVNRDPDLWVVEIEADHGARFLTEPVDES